MAHHNNKGSWSFLQNLIMAILSVALLFIVGIFFFSIFISEELDAQDRLDMISSALERPIDDESYQFVSFNVAKGEFMVIYRSSIDMNCGGADVSWKLDEGKNLAVCIGKENEAALAICQQYSLEAQGEEDIISELWLFVWHAAPTEIARKDRGITHSSIGAPRPQNMSVDAICVSPSAQLQYGLEIQRYNYAFPASNKRDIIRIDIK